MVSPFHGTLGSEIDDITPHLAKFGSESLYLLGVIDYHDLVSRVLFGKLSEHHSRQATDYESARESFDESTSLQISNTGTVVRRRLAPSICRVADIDTLVYETGPVQPRALSLGETMPPRRMFEGFSMSTSGRTLKPRRSQFGYFGRKAA